MPTNVCTRVGTYLGFHNDGALRDAQKRDILLSDARGPRQGPKEGDQKQGVRCELGKECALT